LNLLQRYLFFQATASSLAAAGLLTALLVIANALRDLVPRLADGQIDFWMFGQGLLLLTPFVATYALPAGMLVGVLLALGRLSAQHEITAMRSAGLGLKQVAAPVLFLALIGLVASVVVNFHYGPAARGVYRKTLAEAIQSRPESLLVQRTFVRDFPGYVIYFADRDEARLRDVWVWVVDGQRRATQFIRAREARLSFDESDFAFTLRLLDAQAELRDTKDPESVASPPYVPSAAEVTLRLPLDKLLGGGRQRVSLSWMTIAELRAEHARLLSVLATATGAEAATAQRQEMRVRMVVQERFASAFSVLSFALIAVPLGFKFRRKETSANLGIALVLAMTYYVSMVFIGWLDRRPELRPDLLLWVPNILFQLIGLWLLRRVER
jgi:lipopolysaccharide export system permease protein